jgi:hypothetical protein
MDVFASTVPIFIKYLHNMERWFDTGAEFAKSRDFNPDVFLQMRLAPNQFPLVRHATATCDAAKWAAAKLAGKQGPSHPDSETTLEELRGRIKVCIEYLSSFKPADFAEAEARACSHMWMEGKSMVGRDYVNEAALPNFHFHATSVYQILRHNGVALEKEDYLGELSFAP